MDEEANLVSVKNLPKGILYMPVWTLEELMELLVIRTLPNWMLFEIGSIIGEGPRGMFSSQQTSNYISS